MTEPLSSAVAEKTRAMKHAALCLGASVRGKNLRKRTADRIWLAIRRLETSMAIESSELPAQATAAPVPSPEELIRTLKKLSKEVLDLVDGKVSVRVLDARLRLRNAIDAAKIRFMEKKDDRND